MLLVGEGGVLGRWAGYKFSRRFLASRDMSDQKVTQVRAAVSNGQGSASISAVISFGLVCLSLGGLFSQVDSRLVLTTAETFSGLAGIRDILNQTVNFTALHNPVRVDHVPFPLAPETLEEVVDLRDRGLLDDALVALFKPVNASDPSLLRKLMRTSWCSSGPPIPNTLPATRTPGCKCIADAYLAFVNESRSASVGNLSVFNTTPALRDRIAGQVYRCWDRRQVTRSKTCGNLCRTHVVGLALFANIVLFLTSVAFLIFYSKLPDTWSLFTLKLLLVLVAGVVSIPYFVKYPEANSLNVAAIVVCVLYLIVGLHEELDLYGMDDRVYQASQQVSREYYTTPIPAPFMVCVLVTLPLVLSSHTIQLGVSGYGRDVWALFSFGLCGGLLGLLLQVRVFHFFFLLLLGIDLQKKNPALLLGVFLRRPRSQLPGHCADGPDGARGGLRVRAGPAPAALLGVSIRKRAVLRRGSVHLPDLRGLPHDPGGDPRLRPRGEADRQHPRRADLSWVHRAAGLVHRLCRPRQHGHDHCVVCGRLPASQLIVAELGA